jgi:hypothetical protein
MSHRKTVTEKTLTANRLNAKRSTGPRTKLGKNTSKFNAVKTGLFAEHVVIPICEGSEEQFAQLLADLKQEFRPEGPLEELYVLRSSTSRSWRRVCGDFAERPARRKARSDGGSCRIYMYV